MVGGRKACPVDRVPPAGLEQPGGDSHAQASPSRQPRDGNTPRRRQVPHCREPPEDTESNGFTETCFIYKSRGYSSWPRLADRLADRAVARSTPRPGKRRQWQGPASPQPGLLTGARARAGAPPAFSPGAADCPLSSRQEVLRGPGRLSQLPTCPLPAGPSPWKAGGVPSLPLPAVPTPTHSHMGWGTSQCGSEGPGAGDRARGRDMGPVHGHTTRSTQARVGPSVGRAPCPWPDPRVPTLPTAHPHKHHSASRRQGPRNLRSRQPL